MKKTNDVKLPVCFDDKDLIVDRDTWDFFVVGKDFSMSNNGMSILFFIGNTPYRAMIPNANSNVINIDTLGGAKTIPEDDSNIIKGMFMQDNSWEDNDLYVECFQFGKIMSFQFYHTSEDLREL